MTLFISVIKKMIPYLIVSVFCLIASLIYEHFSHGVVSIFMLYACVVPFTAGILKLIFNKILNKTIYRAGWITLLAYSYLRGVLEIYGTDSPYLIYFLYAAIGMLLLSITIVEKEAIKKDKKEVIKKDKKSRK